MKFMCTPVGETGQMICEEVFVRVSGWFLVGLFIFLLVVVGVVLLVMWASEKL